jgi:Ca2+-binding EF-hand superfamily protein
MAERPQTELVQRWEAMQVKTFTNWCNMHLAKRGKKIESVATDFSDGVNLIQLLEVIGETTITKYVAAPKMRIQKIENVGRALKFIEERGVKLASISAESIVDSNRTLTLGMIWTIILRFAISDLSEEGLSAKQGLLLWVQKKTAGYKDVNVKDFQDSFKDGLAFCALINKHRPDLLNFDGLSKDNARENLDLAFDVCEKHLGIPKLLDTEDIVSMPRPDERSIMTYCAALYKVFSQSDKAEVAGRRLAKFINFLKSSQELIHDYEQRARALRSFIDEKTAEFKALSLANDYQAIRKQIAEFKEYRKNVKVAKVGEQHDLAALLSLIQTKLRSLNRPLYVPPAGLSSPDLDEAMDGLTLAERAYRTALNTQMRAVLDKLRKDFAGPANAFWDKLLEYKSVLAREGEGSLQDQAAALLRSRDEFRGSLEGQLPLIKAAEEACEAANIEENEYSDHSYDDLFATFQQLLRLFEKKVVFLESQANESRGGVPPEKMAEFRASFDHFDVDRDGTLDRLEFKASLASLGLIDVDFSNSDQGSERVFQLVSQGTGHVNFEQYANYMVSLNEDTIDPAQLADAFVTVSGGKDFVTEADLGRAQLSPEQIAFVKASCPKSGDGYDFKAWLAQQ